jgi:hypothetical protein
VSSDGPDGLSAVPPHSFRTASALSPHCSRRVPALSALFLRALSAALSPRCFRLFLRCFRGVSMVFPGCFLGVSGVFPVCF